MICKRRYSKMVKNKDMHFFMENLKKKRKKDKKILTFRSGDLNFRFSVIFPTMVWNVMGSEEDEIKSRQGSYNFSTLASHICLQSKEKVTMIRTKIVENKINICIFLSDRWHYNLFYPFRLIKCLELSLFICLFTFGKFLDLLEPFGKRREIWIWI